MTQTIHLRNNVKITCVREEKRRGRELEDPVNFFASIVACVFE